MVDVSVIIVSWNVKDWLRICLQSLRRHTRQTTYEVFVVDNGSQDGSAEMVETEFPDVHLLRNEANVGFARASNQAIIDSQGKYIVLLNPDTFVRDDALSRMVGFLDDRPGIGALGCKVLTAEGEIDLRCARRFPTLQSELFELTRLSFRFPDNRLFGRYLMSYWDHGDTREVEALSGACMMVRRQAVEEVGLLDETFFLYGEDIDWCYRLKRAGWAIVYYSEAEIVHIGGQSSQQVKEEMGVERFRSGYRFFRKHRGPGYAGAYKALVLLISVMKGLFFGIGFLRNAGKRNYRSWYCDKVKLHGRVLRWALGE